MDATADNRVTVSFRNNKEFGVRIRDHELTCDQPPEDGGFDRGPAPAEWLNAAVGSCIGFYVVSYLQARSLPTEGLEITTSWETEKSPKRIAAIRTRVSRVSLASLRRFFRLKRTPPGTFSRLPKV